MSKDLQMEAVAQPVNHLAIIMDGNGRWATNRGWARLVGHRKGAERVREIVKSAPDLGIRWLTLYAFSTENWKRSTEEVLGLMAIFARYIEREADRLAKAGVRMRFIGDRSRLDPKLQRMMAGIEARIGAHQLGERAGERAVLRRMGAELGLDVLDRRP